MLSVEVFLLNGHRPSANVRSMVDLYLDGCPGVVIHKRVAKNGDELKEIISKHKVSNLPAMRVPGEIVQRRRKYHVLYDHGEMEKWCKSCVEDMNRSVNRRRGGRR